MSAPTDSDRPQQAELIPLVDFTRGRAGADLSASDATFRRLLRKGLLPRRLNVRGQIVFTADEVRLALNPPKHFDDDEAIRQWAKVKAAQAPPMSAAQVDLIVSAFRDALSAKAVA
jgi:hypothetical protein